VASVEPLKIRDRMMPSWVYAGNIWKRWPRWHFDTWTGVTPSGDQPVRLYPILLSHPDSSTNTRWYDRNSDSLRQDYLRDEIKCVYQRITPARVIPVSKDRIPNAGFTVSSISPGSHGACGIQTLAGGCSSNRATCGSGDGGGCGDGGGGDVWALCYCLYLMLALEATELTRK
jgi:hypothetical protein